MDSPVLISHEERENERLACREQDVVWMNGLKERNEADFLSIYHKYSGQVLAVCLRVLQDRHAAEDVLSEVFWEIWREPQRYDSSRSTPQTYLLMVARSRAIDRLREVSRRARVLAEATTVGQAQATAHSEERPDATVDRQEDGEMLREALDTLEDCQRQVLELAFFGGMSHQQIANRLEHPLGTVKSRIRQGLIHLRSKLGPKFAERNL